MTFNGQEFPASLAALFDRAPFGVYAVNAGGFIVYANPRQCENSGRSLENFVGLRYLEVFGASLQKSGTLGFYERLRKDGTPFEVSLPRYQRQSDEAEVALSFCGYRYAGYDLLFTRIDKTLAEQVDRYEQLFENANDGIFVLSTDARFVAVNEAWATMVGMAREELIGKTTEVFLPGRFAQSLQRLQRIIQDGSLGPYEVEIDTPIGRKVISLNGFAVHERGVVSGVMSIARDVTERKREERALERETSFIRLLKDIAVASNQASSTTEVFREALEKICTLTQWPVGYIYSFDREKHEWAPTPIWHLADRERFEPFRRESEATRLAAGAGLPGRVLAAAKPVWVVDVTKDATFLRGNAAREVGLKAGFAFPILVGSEIVAVAELYSDADLEPDPLLLDLVANIGTQLGRVVERERAEKNLAAARDQALESALAKSSFLASVSHEIRTPLNGVIGMAGILANTELSPEQREYTETIRSCADTLLGLINDILDFSKIEAGKLRIEAIPFDLETAAQEVMELLAVKASEKGLNLVLRYDPDAPNQLIGDPVRVRQVLTNLASNAIKFTNAGHVFVNIECERRDDGRAWIRFAVEDSGIGIPVDKQHDIFERFVQADASTTRKYGGSGLGLAISKQLVELMGGHIRLRSEPEKGSTFSFLVPMTLDLEKGQEPRLKTKNLTNVRALIVGDNALNRRVLQELATRWNMPNEACASEAEALAALREAHGHGDPFQVAIVDLGITGGGDVLGRAVKSDPDLRHTTLVLLTSSRQTRHARRAAEVGFVAQLTKPVRPSALMETLITAWREAGHGRKALRISRRETAGEAAPNTPRAGDAAVSGIRVLVVDDNLVNQKVAVLLLQRIGLRVDVAATGKEAVDMVQRVPYDVVFMDCQMPVMDGYEATRQIRRLEKSGEHLAIVAMTAHAMKGDREKCLEAGMDDYLTKPLNREILERALRARVPRPQASLGDFVAEPELGKTLQWMQEQGGDQFVDDVVRDFLKAGRDELSKLARALAAGEIAVAKSLAHGLKGSNATMGAKRLAKACQDLEAGISSSALGAVTLDQLLKEFKQIELMLTRFLARERDRERRSGGSGHSPLAEQESPRRSLLGLSAGVARR
jgi:PAS domain S-box-containing protein